jgi:hypothetical protein
MAPQTFAPAGGSLPHNNLMPYLTFYFNIALQGVFPPRTLFVDLNLGRACKGSAFALMFETSSCFLVVAAL